MIFFFAGDGHVATLKFDTTITCLNFYSSTHATGASEDDLAGRSLGKQNSMLASCLPFSVISPLSTVIFSACKSFDLPSA
jgi:hypothetical protein